MILGDNQAAAETKRLEVLAVERRATVDRIRHAVLFQRDRQGRPLDKIRVTDLLAILDEVAVDAPEPALHVERLRQALLDLEDGFYTEEDARIVAAKYDSLAARDIP